MMSGLWRGKWERTEEKGRNIGDLIVTLSLMLTCGTCCDSSFIFTSYHPCRLTIYSPSLGTWFLLYVLAIFENASRLQGRHRQPDTFLLANGMALLLAKQDEICSA